MGRPISLRPGFLLVAALFLPGGVSLAAQEEGEEPLLGQLEEAVKGPAFSVGALLQFTADFQDDRTAAGENGFAVANARVNVSGELDGGVGYLLQTNFGDLLDLRLSWTGGRAFTVDGGLYKVPFSAEFLTPAGATDFVTRARAVDALRPGRQVGVQVRGRLAADRLEYRAGIFNGSGSPRGNDDGHFAYGARLAYEAGGGGADGSGVVVGLNGFTSDDPARYEGETPDDLVFAGADRLWGADLRAARGGWLLSAEWIGSNPDDDTPDGPRPGGWHVTVGRRVGQEDRVLARWDAFDPDLEGIPDSARLVLGYDHSPTSVTKLQANLEIPARDGGEPRIRFNAQLMF